MYSEAKIKYLVYFEGIRKVYEVNNHKLSDKLEIAYRNTGLIGPEVKKVIKSGE